MSSLEAAQMVELKILEHLPAVIKGRRKSDEC